MPFGESYLLVDDMEWGGGDMLAGRRAIPFTEREGSYWGPPEDSGAAITELRRSRTPGAGFIAFGWPSIWWLDYYAEFDRHLRSEYVIVLETDRVIVFDLRA